ncbi:UNVERIFIED_CONTAM: hypothetical protein FKN15_038444 [Acipenser sinensis]
MSDNDALIRALVSATAAQQDSTRKIQEMQQAALQVQQETNRQHDALLREAREERLAILKSMEQRQDKTLAQNTKQLLGVGKVVVTGNRLVSGWGSVLGKRDVIANKEDKSRARKMGILAVCTTMTQQKVKDEIDYILTNKKHTVHEVSVLNNFNTGSDHRLVRCKMHLNTALERAKLVMTKSNTINTEILQWQSLVFQLELKNRFSGLQDLQKDEAFEVNKIYEEVIQVIEETAKNNAGTHSTKYDHKITQETKDLMK